MDIDFDLLKAERTIDPFTSAPYDIGQSIAFTTESMRDRCLANPEISQSGHGPALCRIRATTPTPRLRQLLAILGWVPLVPTSDDVWVLDEPVPFPRDANGLVVEFTGRCYAEGMNLLFAPDDAIFDGGAAGFEPVASSSGGNRSLIRLMAERLHVAAAVAAVRCPPSILHHRLKLAIERINLARGRGGLEPLTCPSFSTVRRMSREFDATHSGRPGTGRDFVNHRPPITSGSATRALT